jgi:hypothetical protein
VKETGASVCTVVVHPSPHELEPCASKGVGSEPIQSWKNSHTLASDRLKNSLRVLFIKGIRESRKERICKKVSKGKRDRLTERENEISQ